MGYHFGPRTDKIRREGNIPRMPALLQNSVAVGVLVHNMLALLHGMQVVMMAKYDFETLTRYSAKYNLSVFFLAPSIWNRIINEWGVEDCKNIRWAMSGGSPLPLVLQNRVNDALTPGTYLLPNWGMTELVCGATQLDPDIGDNEGSVGFLLPHMEAMIVSESGAELPSGQSGELVVKGDKPKETWKASKLICKGPNVMRGYYRDPSTTLEAFTYSGWFRTGDKATINSRGKVFIEGRYKVSCSGNGPQTLSFLKFHPLMVEIGAH
jgi:acyl-CoA synthetase (AMP-forming)/AMP-acid ligase II